jgi:hypothetical protein
LGHDSELQFGGSKAGNIGKQGGVYELRKGGKGKPIIEGHGSHTKHQTH